MATVEAIEQATLQVLVAEGLSHCTTTRVAERAGVSVGSLYQYFPNRRALLAHLLEKHLTDVAHAVETACGESHGKTLDEMAAALVRAFLAAKLRWAEASKALYALSEEHGGRALVHRVGARGRTAVAAMLATAPSARKEGLDTVSQVALGAIVGPVRAILEDRSATGFAEHLESHLIRMLRAYFRDVVPA